MLSSLQNINFKKVISQKLENARTKVEETQHEHIELLRTKEETEANIIKLQIGTSVLEDQDKEELENNSKQANLQYKDLGIAFNDAELRLKYLIVLMRRGHFILVMIRQKLIKINLPNEKLHSIEIYYHYDSAMIMMGLIVSMKWFAFMLNFFMRLNLCL